MDNLACLLACNRIQGLGIRSLLRLQKNYPNLAQMFQADLSDLLALGLSQKIGQAILGFDFRTIESDLRWMLEPQHHILVWGHPQYPALLAEIPDPPPILYAKGNLECLNQSMLSVVGTRNPSISGFETAWHFAHDLAQAGLTIVSGLALGIDAQAHRGCLAAQGQTIAVMGTGMDIIYPRRHQTLADQILENGLLLSEFPLASPPVAHHFPQRNRIISGLSSALLVVEAALRSGSLITARYAMEQNRDVFAIPGSIYHTQAKGCLSLLQQGACLVTTPQEICAEMHLSGAPFIKNISISPQICDNTMFLEYIGFDVTSVDKLVEYSGLSIDDVLCHVVDLELRGLIQVVPGGYMRCR